MVVIDFLYFLRVVVMFFLMFLACGVFATGNLLSAVVMIVIMIAADEYSMRGLHLLESCIPEGGGSFGLIQIVWRFPRRLLPRDIRERVFDPAVHELVEDLVDEISVSSGWGRERLTLSFVKRICVLWVHCLWGWVRIRVESSGDS